MLPIILKIRLMSMAAASWTAAASPVPLPAESVATLLATQTSGPVEIDLYDENDYQRGRIAVWRDGSVDDDTRAIVKRLFRCRYTHREAMIHGLAPRRARAVTRRATAGEGRVRRRPAELASAEPVGEAGVPRDDRGARRRRKALVGRRRVTAVASGADSRACTCARRAPSAPATRARAALRSCRRGSDGCVTSSCDGFAGVAAGVSSLRTTPRPEIPRLIRLMAPPFQPRASAYRGAMPPVRRRHQGPRRDTPRQHEAPLFAVRASRGRWFCRR